MEPDLDRQAAALNMMQAGIGSLSGNTINQPTPFDDAKSNYIFGSNTPGHAISQQNRWEKAGGRGAYPVFDESWNPDTTPRIIPFRSDGVYPYMTTPFKKGWMEAGITNPNLRGAKVMNADWRESGPAQWLGKKTFPFINKYFGNPLDKLLGYDETPSEFANPHLDDQGPPLDDEGNLLPGWELHQDGWNYFPPNEGEERYEDYINRGLEEMDTPYTLEADLNLQDVMDAHDALGLDLDTNRFIKRANKAGVQVAGMDDSLQYLQRQIDELDRDSPNYDDQLEMLINDMEMKYPWAVS
tara:strand:- start:98 stop:991 length:894 start_codon:yes stop_codon:yes gene_type:complete